MFACVTKSGFSRVEVHIVSSVPFMRSNVVLLYVKHTDRKRNKILPSKFSLSIQKKKQLLTGANREVNVN